MFNNRLDFCWIRLLLLLSLMSAAGCSGGNGNDGGGVTPGPEKLTATIIAPSWMEGGLSAQWSAAWSGGVAPYTVQWDLGDGAASGTYAESTEALGGTFSAIMANATTAALDYTATLMVTSSDSQTMWVSTAYSVAPDRSPVIGSISFNAETGVLTIVATSTVPGAALMAAVNEPDGLRADFITKSMSQTSDVSATASFTWEALDQLAGGSGDCEVVVVDGLGRTTKTHVQVAVPPIELLPDTIYAIPQTNHAKVGDVVTVVVATGVPAHPFQYLVGVNVTYPTWVEFTSQSYPRWNYGAPGGAQGDADGIWGENGMGLSDGSFLIGPEPFMFPGWEEKSDFGISERHRMEFYIVPLGGHDITGISGALLNFQVKFDHAGTASFGFIESTPPIDRTYYRDGSNNDYYWGTLMAGPDGVLNVEGVNNTIVVTE